MRDGCSVADAATFAARRAEDLLVQPLVLSGGRAALPGVLPEAAGGVARHLTRFFPHHGRRESAAGPDEARLSLKDNSPFGYPVASGPDGGYRRLREHACDPTASPSLEAYARVS